MTAAGKIVLRLLVQAEADADPIEFALRTAGALGGRVHVVNGTGKELGGYRLRHDFVELVDGQGRATRSVSEIIEAVRASEPGELGCLVILDVSRIYRASRCAVRQGESVKELSPGHWDLVNESLGRLGEELNRKGVPSVWTAPSAAVHGQDEDGREIVVGSAPQVWRDLTRQAHAWLALERRGTSVDAEIRGDDCRALGVLGEVLRGVDALEVGRRLAPFVARDGRPSTTLMEEAATAELAARARLEDGREREAAAIVERYQDLAAVRALRGREHWDALLRSWDRERHELSAERARQVDQVLASYERIARHAWGTIAAFERTAEFSCEEPELALGLTLAGPAPEAATSAQAGDPIELLARVSEDAAPAWADGLDHEQVIGWLRAMAEFLGVWSRPRLAAIAATVMDRHLPGRPASLPSNGPDWGAYELDELRNLLVSVHRMASIEHRAGASLANAAGPAWREGETTLGRSPAPTRLRALEPASTERPRPARPDAPTPPATSSTADYLELVSTTDEPEQGEIMSATLELPSPRAFAGLERRDQVVYLSVLLTRDALWGELPALCERSGVSSRSRHLQRWTERERESVYAAVLSARSPGPAPPLAVLH